MALAAAFLAQPVGWCNLHEDSSSTGSGCCDAQPAVCSGFTRTYSASCLGACTYPSLCLVKNAEEKLV